VSAHSQESSHNYDNFTYTIFFQGYFLLHYMASLVGVTNFDNFLKEYVLEYGGKVVNSEVRRGC
jgi:hypothetical protein